MEDKKIERLVKKVEKLEGEVYGYLDEIARLLKMKYGYPEDTKVEYICNDGCAICFEERPEIEAIILKGELVPFDEL